MVFSPFSPFSVVSGVKREFLLPRHKEISQNGEYKLIFATDALEALRSPRWEDWVYESREGDGEGGNALRWLGNGWSTTQTSGDASWYINPDEIEVPYGKKPEENPRFKARPWSY